MRVFVAAIILCATSATYAQAQSDDPWVILGSSHGAQTGWLKPTAVRLRAELTQRGVEVWGLDEAAARFEENGSGPAAEVTEGDIQQWVDQSSGAIRNLAEGNYAAALKQLNEAQELSRSAADELNREQERAQRNLDTCLYMVRVLLDTGSRSRATKLVQECRQLAPRVEPTKMMHPPEVLALLRKVDASRAKQPRELSVDSEPSGCAVRVNGVLLGETPLELRDLLPGRYRVQVECEPNPRGRVHVADVTEGSTTLFVDLRFDSVVETRPLLRLRYADKDDEARYEATDAATVAKVIPASSVVVASKVSSKVLELERLGGEPWSRQGLARVRTGERGPSRADIALAASALADGLCMDFTGSSPRTVACGTAAPIATTAPPPLDTDWPERRMPRGRFISGVTLATLGSAVLITGAALRLPAVNAGKDWAGASDAGASQTEFQNRTLNLNTTSMALAAGGAVALVTAMPLALPKRERVPWFAWLSGGLGLGLAGVSIALGVTAPEKPARSCTTGGSQLTRAEVGQCVDRGDQVTWAVIAGAAAAPLLTIPLVYLFRKDEMKLQAVVQPRRGGGFVMLKGDF